MQNNTNFIKTILNGINTQYDSDINLLEDSIEKIENSMVAHTQQKLSEEQKKQARSNIESAANSEVVKHIEQNLSDSQKEQARTNINAAYDSEVVKHVIQDLSFNQKTQARDNIDALSSETSNDVIYLNSSVDGSIKKYAVTIDNNGNLSASVFTPIEERFSMKLLGRTISHDYKNDRVTKIGSQTFSRCYQLTSVNFPKVLSVGYYSFSGDSLLTKAIFPAATSLESGVFYGCSSLEETYFPNVETIGSEAFFNCTRLKKIDLPKVTHLGSQAFTYCYDLQAIILRSTDKVCELETRLSGGPTYKAYVYVPASMLESYKTSDMWDNKVR